MAITSIISVLSVILGAVFLTLITISRVPSHGEEICMVTWIFFLTKERKQNSVFLSTKFSDKLSLVSSSSSIISFHSWASLPSSSWLISSNSPSSFSRFSSLSSSIRQKQSQTLHHLFFNALVCVTRKMIKKMHKSTKTTLIYQLKTIDFRIALCPRWRWNCIKYIL